LVCGQTPVFKESKHLFIAITQLKDKLINFINSHPGWRKNAIAFSNRYINEGLRDRAITRDLEWGIDVPKNGYDSKKIYIWAENVLGYLSASKQIAEERGEDFAELWSDKSKHYYVHGKDNIPFHTIILPSILFAHGGNWHLPDEIVSSEHLTLEGRKISTSRNWAIWVKDIADRYDPDSLRYFFIANGLEKKDNDFSWREYVNNHNGELLGAYGNFINRNLVFIDKYFDKVVPNGALNIEIEKRIQELYTSVGSKIEQANFRDALDEIFEFVRYSNKYFDTEKPWVTRNTDITSCENTLFNCVQIIANLVILLAPFLPFSSSKICDWLNITNEWKPQFIKIGFIIPKPDILFERIDKKVIDEEIQKLKR
jgi:methionyl-tRNA synthetase